MTLRIKELVLHAEIAEKPAFDTRSEKVVEDVQKGSMTSTFYEEDIVKKNER